LIPLTSWEVMCPFKGRAEEILGMPSSFQVFESENDYVSSFLRVPFDEYASEKNPRISNALEHALAASSTDGDNKYILDGVFIFRISVTLTFFVLSQNAAEKCDLTVSSPQKAEMKKTFTDCRNGVQSSQHIPSFVPNYRRAI
jgi:hypothetical protein